MLEPSSPGVQSFLCMANFLRFVDYVSSLGGKLLKDKYLQMKVKHASKQFPLVCKVSFRKAKEIFAMVMPES